MAMTAAKLHPKILKSGNMSHPRLPAAAARCETRKCCAPEAFRAGAGPFHDRGTRVRA